MITILAGGSGSVKLVRGFASQRTDINVVTKVGDNYWLYGMYICPDIDSPPEPAQDIYKACTGANHEQQIKCLTGAGEHESQSTP